MEQWWKISEENIENNLVFCIDPRTAFTIKSIPRSVFRNPSHKNKYVYFLFRVNLDFGFFIKSWRNRLCIWTILQERVDLNCNFWSSLPFKLTTVGEVWWPLQLRTTLYSRQYPVYRNGVNQHLIILWFIDNTPKCKYSMMDKGFFRVPW